MQRVELVGPGINLEDLTEALKECSALSLSEIYKILAERRFIIYYAGDKIIFYKNQLKKIIQDVLDTSNLSDTTRIIADMLYDLANKSSKCQTEALERLLADCGIMERFDYVYTELEINGEIEDVIIEIEVIS